MEKIKLTADQINECALRCANHIIRTVTQPRDGYLLLYGIPRGGIPAAYAVSTFLPGSRVTDDLSQAHVVIDDIVDSGATMEHLFTSATKVALVSKHPAYFGGASAEAGDWIVFPWETANGQDDSATDIPIRLLQYIGEDPGRGGLLETPRRFLKAWEHWSAGYKKDPAEILKVFEDGAEKVDELVLIKDIPIYSHCEHHLAPFFGVAHVGYIPNGKIVGLSKLSRLVDIFAQRLQVQERLTNQIADALEQNLAPLGVGVIIECRHLCMESRGIQRQGSSTTTSAMRGVLREKPEARAEFMSLVSKKQ